ncbi:MAG: protease complex subunit PrcB family protein [Vicinamibacterales bacterium]
MKVLLSLILVTAMQAVVPSAVKVVSREMMSMVDEPKQAVARSAAEWAALWRQHAGDKPLPVVDFRSRTVVAVFLGTRSSAGFAADITAVRKANGVLVIEWQERRPPTGEVSAQVLTSPAIIASVPKFAGEIKFEKVER